MNEIDKISNEKQAVLSEFEEYLLKTTSRQSVVADRLSNILGVLIDIKPTCIIDFNPNFESFDLAKFEQYLEKLDLKFIYDHTKIGGESELDFVNTYFMSKNLETVKQLVEAEHKLYNLFNTDEPNSPLIKNQHRLIGRLLGYPETAIEFFLIRQEKMDLGEIEKSEWQKDLKTYFHFIHSRLNGEEEFELYDRPIHEAMDKYLPTSAKIMQSAFPGKRWL